MRHLTIVTSTLTNAPGGSASYVSPAAGEHEGFTPKYGARPITGVIRQQLRRPISRLIISGEARPGTVLALDKAEDSDTVTWTTTQTNTETALETVAALPNGSTADAEAPAEA